MSMEKYKNLRKDNGIFRLQELQRQVDVIVGKDIKKVG